MSAATTWACYPHGTRVVQEDEPTFDCVEADRSGCSWERVGSAGCQLDGCAGLNPDGVCPNDYGVTCELVFAEPSNMDDDPLRAPVDWDELADRRWREERGLRMKSAATTEPRTELCEARYMTGEFAGVTCIERAVEARYDLGLCKRHAKVWDRWLTYGYDYARSMARYEWQVEIHA